MVSFVDAHALRTLVPFADAVDALREALIGGLDPETDPARLSIPIPGGGFLLMPSWFGSYCGVKVLTSAPGNPGRGFPAVQGLYTLFRSDGLTPVAVLAADELTLLRTPAVSALVVQEVLKQRDACRCQLGVVLGTGPQAERHTTAFLELGIVDRIALLGRNPDRTRPVVTRLRDRGFDVLAAEAEDVARADVLVAATSSRVPVVDDNAIRIDAVVCSIGVHEPDAHELPPALIHRSHVLVEARAAALRESGNLLMARTAREWAGLSLPNIADLMNGRVALPEGRPVVFSGVGMGWQDLVVAALAHERDVTGRF
jgi:1-piperideine-2-carboxylate/1-pyrroline-2-carboxylate reductase [NAD(P)H]